MLELLLPVVSPAVLVVGVVPEPDRGLLPEGGRGHLRVDDQRRGVQASRRSPADRRQARGLRSWVAGSKRRKMLGFPYGHKSVADLRKSNSVCS